MTGALCVDMCLELSPLYAAGQTSEGVLANFFNSLLTKKAGTGGSGTPGGGNNTPGTVRKSGENSHEVFKVVMMLCFNDLKRSQLSFRI